MGQGFASDGVADKFYTRPGVAAHAVSLIPDLASYPVVVEPSAGNGSFLRALPAGTRAFDIAPEAEGIEEADWFAVNDRFDGGILVGNPPFGRRSALARQFIRHGIDLGFETVAFILPATFRKLHSQRVFPPEWSLVVDADLPDRVFEHVAGNISIPCVFQVWTRRPSAVNRRKAEHPKPSEYAFLPRGAADADLCLNGNSGAVRKPSEITNPKAEHYIRLNVPSGQRKAVEDRLRTLDMDFHSSVSGGVAWVSKAEINEAWWRAAVAQS